MKRRGSVKVYTRNVLRCWLDGTAPSRNQLFRLCPHLSRGNVEGKVMRGDLFALPPVRSGGDCFVALYHPAYYVDDPTPYIEIMSRCEARRKYSSLPLKFEKEALDFAKKYWPREVVADRL